MQAASRSVGAGGSPVSVPDTPHSADTGTPTSHSTLAPPQQGPQQKGRLQRHDRGRRDVNATTLRDALRSWQRAYGVLPSEAEELKLRCQRPPIYELDADLLLLLSCRSLSLCLNRIRRIEFLSGLRLERLALTRNCLQSLAGLELVAGTLEVLWVSFNELTSLAGIERLTRLRDLGIASNRIAEWTEIERLAALPGITELAFSGNPVCSHSPPDQQAAQVVAMLPNLRRLDGIEVLRAAPGAVGVPAFTLGFVDRFVADFITSDAQSRGLNDSDPASVRGNDDRTARSSQADGSDDDSASSDSSDKTSFSSVVVRSSGSSADSAGSDD